MTSSSAPENCVTIGTGLPPVPDKLVSRIEAREYIDMTELLPDQLGTTRSPAIDDPVKTRRQQRRALSGILEVVGDYLQTEISLGHVSGPFLPEAI